jgi:hypothetical protein
MGHFEKNKFYSAKRLIINRYIATSISVQCIGSYGPASYFFPPLENTNPFHLPLLMCGVWKYNIRSSVNSVSAARRPKSNRMPQSAISYLLDWSFRFRSLVCEVTRSHVPWLFLVWVAHLIFWLLCMFNFLILCMFRLCILVPLPPGVNPIAVKYISYHITWWTCSNSKNRK